MAAASVWIKLILNFNPGYTARHHLAIAKIRNYAYTEIINTIGVNTMAEIQVSSHKVFVQRRNLISLPREIRETLNINEGDVLDIRLIDDKIVIEPMKLIPSSQAYFWTDKTQNDMLEAKKDVDSGSVREFKTIKEFLDGIEQ
ncbi:MAG: AbrB/MazE/SpoVT family DNA-binding domain-containing protein [Actinobacteria bacterium]|nr:AbrB/MazE/SpoVT family DNA-binding domain-containing protein [Actinomycetota bacterium]